MAPGESQRQWARSSVVRAADCRSAGRWFKSGRALLPVLSLTIAFVIEASVQQREFPRERLIPDALRLCYCASVLNSLAKGFFHCFVCPRIGASRSIHAEAKRERVSADDLLEF